MEFGLNRTGGVRPLRPRCQSTNAAAIGILYLVGCVAYRPYTCFVFDIHAYFKLSLHVFTHINVSDRWVLFIVALWNRADHYIFML